jgi:hypothetical protein
MHRRIGSGHTAKGPANAIDGDLSLKIRALSRTQYFSLNDAHFSEKLSTEHVI